jgi:hypothetical protein
MVVVDKLTKSAHFIPVKSTFDAPSIAQVFLKEIIHLAWGASKNHIRQRFMVHF